MKVNYLKIRHKATIILLLFFVHLSFAQFEIPAKPAVQTSVYDYAKILTVQEKEKLEEKLIKYSDSTSNQIVVIIIESLKGEDIAVVTTKWAQNWGIGDRVKDNGVAFLISTKDKKLDIRSGYGLEDRMTAGITGEIIRNVIKPEFKAGNFYKGIDLGTNAIFDVIKGKYKATPKEKKGNGSPLLYIIGLIILFFIISKSKNNGKNGGKSGGLDLADILILSSMGRGFGGSGGFGSGKSSGGGGFGGGFGGGGFSGGGASGSW